MGEHAGDEPARHLREVALVARVVEGVGVALEQREVRVHARPLHVASGLGMNVACTPASKRHLPHDEPERHDVVGHGQRIGVAEVDLVLARRVLVVAVLHRDPHGLERVDRALAQVGGHVRGGEIEVRRLVERARGLRGVGVGEVEELHLRGGVEAEAALAGLVEVAPEHLAGVALERGAVDVGDVAEHPGRRAVGVGPREQLEAVGVGAGQHVALLHPAEPVDGGAVEAHALVEGALELGGRDGEGLELARARR